MGYMLTKLPLDLLLLSMELMRPYTTSPGSPTTSIMQPTTCYLMMVLLVLLLALLLTLLMAQLQLALYLSLLLPLMGPLVPGGRAYLDLGVLYLLMPLMQAPLALVFYLKVQSLAPASVTLSAVKPWLCGSLWQPLD